MAKLTLYRTGVDPRLFIYVDDLEKHLRDEMKRLLDWGFKNPMAPYPAMAHALGDILIDINRAKEVK